MLLTCIIAPRIFTETRQFGMLKCIDEMYFKQPVTSDHASGKRDG